MLFNRVGCFITNEGLVTNSSSSLVLCRHSMDLLALIVFLIPLQSVSASTELVGQFVKEKGLSNACRTSLVQLLSSPHSSWSQVMLLSLGHTPPSLMSESLADFGDFDSCIQIQEETFSGKYCLYRQHHDMNSSNFKRLITQLPPDFEKFLATETVAGSLCLPSTCSDDEIIALIQKFMVKNGARVEIRTGCETIDRIFSTETIEDQPFFQMTLVAYLLFLSIASISSEMFDSEFLRCFSVHRNAASLFEFKRIAATNRDFTSGWKFIFYWMACMCHFFHLLFFWTPLALINFAKNSPDINTQIKGMADNRTAFVGSSLSFSGFFSFSGRRNQLKRSGNLKFAKSIIVRILRILPSVFGAYLLILSLPAQYFYGPIFREAFTIIRNSCHENWLLDLTFMQNTVLPTKLCIPTAWVMAPDMQFFVATFPLIFLHYKQPKLAKAVTLCIILLSIPMTGLYDWLNKYPPFLNSSSYDVKSYMDNFGQHASSIHSLPGYLFGFQAAMYLHDLNSYDSLLIRHCFTVTFLIAFMTQYWASSWRVRGEISSMEKMIYASVNRTLSATFGWGVFVSQSTVGQTWKFTKFLSSRFFVIFGRLYFASFIGHWIHAFIYMSTRREPLYYGLWSMIFLTTYGAFCGMFFGFFIHIMFEAPSVRLSKLLLEQTAAKSKSN